MTMPSETARSRGMVNLLGEHVRCIDVNPGLD